MVPAALTTETSSSRPVSVLPVRTPTMPMEYDASVRWSTWTSLMRVVIVEPATWIETVAGVPTASVPAGRFTAEPRVA